MDRKKALISGAASGIGRATAERFAREGWDLCITDRNAPGLLSVFQELPAGDHLHCPGDFTDPLAVARISERIAESWGHLDALVNCAGVFMSADAVESPLEEWRRSLDIMINGAVNLTRACVPKMKQGGRIIHITSIHSQRAEKGSSAYAMAKAAVGQYCRGLAVELAGRGILVNAIAPGFIDTPMGIGGRGRLLYYGPGYYRGRRADGDVLTAYNMRSRRFLASSSGCFICSSSEGDRPMGTERLNPR